MRIEVLQGGIEKAQADTIIVNLFEGVSSPGGATGVIDQALGGAISELIAGGDFQGKEGEMAVLYPRGAMEARRVIIVGLGQLRAFDLEQVRRASAHAIRRARDLKARVVATVVHGAGLAGLDVAACSQAVVEGSLLALYAFDKPRQQPPEQHQLELLTIVEFDPAKVAAIRSGAEAAEAICNGSVLARNLVNLPPNYATPTYLAEIARQIAEEHGLDLIVGDRAWASKRNMGAFLGVAKGAGDEPRFIVLEYNKDRHDLDTIVLVGKGITFDTGGITLKSGANMWKMKGDMGGAAAVLGTMKAVASLQLPLHLVAIAPCTENKPDADAYRPSDVLTASNGKTIEIISTDAEGRLALADGLVFAAQYEANAVIDLATLTGSCQVALGRGTAAGIFSTDDELRDRLVEAGGDTYERLWPLPLYDDYTRRIQSDSADIKNSGGQYGGVGTSAAFLKEFTSYRWAHLDIAGMELAEESSAYIPKGATGFGVRLLAQFLRNW